jgi:hypothetical protein
MADSTKHSALTAAIAKVRAQQLEDLRNASFLGWTPELVTAHDKKRKTTR